MAHLIPRSIPEILTNEPSRRAELLLYHASKALCNKWWVLYGVSWYFVEARSVEGEADFVFVSEDNGIIVVEVKGGGISREDDRWYSVSRKGERHEIKNPVAQAQNAKHQILRYLKQKPELSKAYLPRITHMVCFPDVRSADLPSTIDMPRDIVICADDLDCLAERLKRINVGSQSLDGTFISSICKLLKPEFSCPTKYSVAAKRNLQIMEKLTEEQERIWDMLDENHHVALSGPAGSGKTILAMKKIQREIENGGKALVLLPSKTLAEYYESMFAPKRVAIRNYNDSLPQGQMKAQADEHEIPTLVVIEEAQDLCEDTWLQFYEDHNIDDVEKLLVVYDSNQQLRNMDSFYLPPNLLSVQLNGVIRNTQEIGKFSLGFYANSKKVECLGPGGAKVEFAESKSFDDDLNVAAQIIKRFIFKEDFDYKDIVVLTASGDDYKVAHVKEQLKTRHKLPNIRVENIHDFRGLESNIIILIGLGGAKSEERIPWCYIGASRAKSALVIVGTRSLIKIINPKERSVRIQESRFHVDTGPTSLFERVLFKFSDVESLSLQVQNFKKNDTMNTPDEIYDALVCFDRSKLNLIMAETRNDSGKFISSTWSIQTTDGTYWVEIGFNNSIKSIIKPTRKQNPEVIKSGNMFNFVSEVNDKLMKREIKKAAKT